MIVFFTSSFSGKKDFQPLYDEAVKSIQQNGAKVISLELEKYEDLLGKKAVEKMTDDQAHYAYTKTGMNKAQAIVIEASKSSFYLGHEVTLGLLLNKPVLCISSTWDYSTRIKHPKFYAHRYQDKSELRTIIKEFLDSVKNKHLSVRFNGFLNPDQKNFLDWYSHKHSKNVSEIIRDLIDQQKNNTPEYLEELLNLETKRELTPTRSNEK